MERYRVHAGATVLTYYCKVQCAIIIHKECKGLQSARERCSGLLLPCAVHLMIMCKQCNSARGAAVLAYYCDTIWRVAGGEEVPTANQQL